MELIQLNYLIKRLSSSKRDTIMSKHTSLFEQLKSLSSEQGNNRSSMIDSKKINEILSIINSEDQKVAQAVRKEAPSISKAVELVVESLKSGGRLIYIGAGTSGRLGVLDAAECTPTFGVNPSTVQGIIAGGDRAVFKSQEGVEDNYEAGKDAMRRKRVREKDVVCGIAASLRTPYVIAAVKEAKQLGAKTIYITTNPRSVLNKPEFRELRKSIDVAICPSVGPEVIMGSTRMKSGTAQKLVLNMITTTAMIRLGKVYKNMMVDLKMNSKKLEERAKRVLMIATGISYEKATKALSNANGHVKTAIVMIKSNVSAKQARARLKRAGGFIRIAINDNEK
jgi:N-acetylmuramic acid 6-phosphate etherase